MQQLVAELWQRHGCAILLVTHDVEEALLLADRVLVMDEGRIAHELTVDLPRPRDLTAPEFVTLRARLLELARRDPHPGRNPLVIRRIAAAALEPHRPAGADRLRRGLLGGRLAGKGQVTLTIGDQAKTLQTIVAASDALKGAKYKVKWAEFEGAAPLYQAVQAGAADTGYSADLPALQALSGGVQVKNVAALQNDGRHVGIVVRKDSGIDSVKDLKGQKVVVSSAKGSISEYLLANVLKQNGLSYKDVKVQYLLPTDAQAAFASGKIKVWATFGVYQAVGLEQGGKLLVDGADGRVSGIGFINASDEGPRRHVEEGRARRLPGAPRYGTEVDQHPPGRLRQGHRDPQRRRRLRRQDAGLRRVRQGPADHGRREHGPSRTWPTS